MAELDANVGQNFDSHCTRPAVQTDSGFLQSSVFNSKQFEGFFPVHDGFTRHLPRDVKTPMIQGWDPFALQLLLGQQLPQCDWANDKKQPQPNTEPNKNDEKRETVGVNAGCPVPERHFRTTRGIFFPPS